METLAAPVRYDACRENIEAKLLGLQQSLSNNEEIDYEDLRQMLTQIITPAVSEIQADQQERELVLDSLFKWKPISEKNSPANRVESLLEKKKGYKNEQDSQWAIIILNLVMCYEYVTHLDEPAKASTLLDECDAMLDECDDPEDFIRVNRLAFRRVVRSSRYHVSPGDRSAILAELRPHAELTQDTIAALWGIRGAVHMEYGYTGNKLAEMYLHTAIKFNPNVAQWHFLYGQCLGRLRHVHYSLNLPKDIELISLERAVELSNNPYYVTYLAQAYREAASSLYWQQSSSEELKADMEKTADRMNRRAVELYEEALQLCPDCPFINVRCAQGFMRFRGAYQDMRRAHDCCQKAIELCPANTMINHVWGQINDRMRNFKLANKHLRIAAFQGAFGACMDLVRLNIRNTRSYDPRPFYSDMLKRFPAEPYQIECNVQLGMYYYYEKRDLAKAVELIMRGVDIDPLSDKLKTHRNPFSKARDVNVYSILIEAADLASEEEKKTKFGQVMSICKTHYPELLELENRSKSPGCESVRLEPENRKGAPAANWRNNQQGDGNWKRTEDDSFKKNWRDPEGRNLNVAQGSYQQRYQNGRGQGERWYGASSRSRNYSETSRSDYGSDRDACSEAGSSVRGGSGYDSGTGGHSEYGGGSRPSSSVGRLTGSMNRMWRETPGDGGAGDRTRVNPAKTCAGPIKN